MQKNLVATASKTVDASRQQVWDALTDPQAVRQYMFGTTIVTDWREGSPIIWKGEWQGKQYEDKGAVLQFKPGRLLQYSHYSPLSGVPDKPENYHTVTVELADEGDKTRVTLAQDHNGTEEERDHSATNWEMMLEALRKYLER